MAFMLSPGVNVSEIDLTTVVPAVGTTEGAFVGSFNWGPVNKITQISNEVELESRFGKPSSDTFESFFSAANFLAYARNLKMVRAVGAGANNATDGVPLIIENSDDYMYNYQDMSALDKHGMFAARYPSALGNSLKVSVFAGNSAVDFASWEYKDEFIGVPGTSNYVDGVNGVNDEMHVIVVDKDGKFSGIAGTVLEKFSYLSKASDAKNDDGSSNYYVNVISDRSKYIYVLGHQYSSNAKVGSVTVSAPGTGYSNGNIVFEGGLGSGAAGYINVNTTGAIVSTTILTNGYNYKLNDVVTANVSSLGGSSASLTVNIDAIFNSTNWGTTASNTTFAQGNSSFAVSLAGGVADVATDASLIAGYDKFANAEEVDISLIVTGNASPTVVQHVIDNIASVRRDCVAFISPSRTSVVNNSGDEVNDITTFRNTSIARSSSYVVMDSGWKKQFDKYNNVYRWVPLNGDIAGLCVRTDYERDPWFSPAGFNRGAIKNVVQLSWNPNKSERDELYKNGINPVVSFPGEGVILYGDKTLLAKPSAFDRINVRRLFIVLEKAIARASRYSMFEFNDEFTRAQFVALVEPYLRDVQGRRGIYDFRVVCNETNNTPEVIDRNEFVGDIYIKPARSINFIQLNFVAVRTGVAFEEIVGRF